MFLLAVAGAFALIAAAFFTRAYLRPRPCHYCREAQPPHGLHKIELSGAGVVEVCRDAGACRLRHQRALAR